MIASYARPRRISRSRNLLDVLDYPSYGSRIQMVQGGVLSRACDHRLGGVHVAHRTADTRRGKCRATRIREQVEDVTPASRQAT